MKEQQCEKSRPIAALTAIAESEAAGICNRVAAARALVELGERPGAVAALVDMAKDLENVSENDRAQAVQALMELGERPAAVAALTAVANRPEIRRYARYSMKAMQTLIELGERQRP